MTFYLLVRSWVFIDRPSRLLWTSDFCDLMGKVCHLFGGISQDEIEGILIVVIVVIWIAFIAFRLRWIRRIEENIFRGLHKEEENLYSDTPVQPARETLPDKIE